MTGLDRDHSETTALPAGVPADSAQRVVGAARRFTSEQLLAGEIEIEIVHGSLVYRLRQTSLGKLILTK